MAIAMPASARAPLAASWRRALPALAVLLGAILLAYGETFASMVAIWSRSGTFAHAFLVPPIVGWLIWRERHRLALLQPHFFAWALLPLAILAALWLLGSVASSNAVTQVAATALLEAAVLLVLGPRVTRALLFPLVFLFFAVPVGEFMMPRMIDWTADFTVFALRVSGIPVYREGTRFIIPSGSWSVVEACSGIRYLMASLMVGTLFAYLQYRTTWKRWLFVVFSLLVPIVANWLRAYLIVLAGHLSNNTVAVGFDHLVYGWIFFGLVVGIMFFVGTRWSEDQLETGGGKSVDTEGESSDAFELAPRAEAIWAAVVAAVIVTISPHLFLHAGQEGRSSGTPQLAGIAHPGAGWQASDAEANAWKPVFENPSAEAGYRYVSAEGRSVGVYLAYYRDQDFQRKLVSSNNVLVDSKDPVWLAVEAPHTEKISTGSGSVSMRSRLLQGDSAAGHAERRLLAWQVYWVADTLTESDTRAKLLGVWDRLRGRGDDSAAIVLYSTDDSAEARRDALAAFAQANLESLVTQLRKTRDSAKLNVAVGQAETRAGGTRP